MCSRIFQAAGIAALMIMGLGATASADPVNLQITSNGAWRSNDTFVAGWETIGFDDSAWANARAPYPSPGLPTDLIPGTTAQFIWHDPAGTSNGATGPLEVYVRFSFELDLIGANAALTASANISVDDDYDLYVNGELAFQNNDGGFAHLVQTVDIAPFLRHGANVIAIYAVDLGGFERVLFDASVATLARMNIPIVSGDDWLTSATFEAGWETIGFDDASWSAARAPYPGASATTFMPDTKALAMWHDPSEVSDGTTGSIHAYFRYSFELTGTAQTLPVVGQARINVDDDYDLYVNGILVHENHDDGNAHLVQFVDFTYALRAGPNVIAIHAVDGGWSNPRNRGSERLAFDGLVASGVLDWQFVPIVEGPLIWGGCASNPVLDGDLLALTAACELQWHFPNVANTAGVHKLDLVAQTSELVAGEFTPTPGAAGSYLSWFMIETGEPSIDNGEVAFPATIRSESNGEIIGKGIFIKGDGPIETLVDTDTPIPGGTGTFNALQSPSLSEGRIAFSADGDGQAGTYIADSTGVTVVADRSTAIPTGGTFTDFGVWPSIDRGNVAFLGYGPVSGIYLYDSVSATIGVVADTLTEIPGGSGTLFGNFSCSPDYNDGTVSFSNDGIYTWSAGTLHTLSAAGGCHPPTSGGRTAFDHAFSVHTDIGLGVNEVIGGDNPLDDIFVEPHVIATLDLFHDGIARNRVAFNAEVIETVTPMTHEMMIVADDAFTFDGDADGDGIADNADNCTLHANGAQSDTNGDGYGNACDPDLTNDGSVNFADLAEMDDVFFSADPDADLNQDGVVNFADLAITKLFFFGPPGPSALVQ